MTEEKSVLKGKYGIPMKTSFGKQLREGLVTNNPDICTVSRYVFGTCHNDIGNKRHRNGAFRYRCPDLLKSAYISSAARYNAAGENSCIHSL